MGAWLEFRARNDNSGNNKPSPLEIMMEVLRQLGADSEKAGQVKVEQPPKQGNGQTK